MNACHHIISQRNSLHPLLQSLDNIALRKEQLSIILPILTREANGGSAMLMGDFNFDPNLFVKKVLWRYCLALLIHITAHHTEQSPSSEICAVQYLFS